MPDLSESPVDCLGIEPVQPAHARYEIAFGGFEQQMVMVAHQAIGKQTPPLLPYLPGQEIQEQASVNVAA